MYLLEAQDILRAKPRARRVDSEYELRVRVNLTGVLDLEAVYVQFWEVPSEGDPKADRSVLLRVRSLEPRSQKYDLSVPPRRKQYYLPGGLPAEAVVLLTLFTRAHFVLLRTLKVSGIPLMQFHHPRWDIARSPIDGRTLALGDLVPLFRQLEGLREHEGRFRSRRVEPFMLAARLYHLALTLRDADESLAYVTLVSAVEALLHDYEVKAPSLAKSAPQVARVIREVSPGGYSKIAKAVLSRERHLALRFRRFILEYLPKAFWCDPLRPKAKPARFGGRWQVGEYLDRIYRARSLTVHQARPFPPNPDIHREHVEVPMHFGAQVGRRRWEEKDLLPSFRAFEHIVHHVLVEYLRREAAKARVPASG